MWRKPVKSISGSDANLKTKWYALTITLILVLSLALLSGCAKKEEVEKPKEEGPVKGGTFIHPLYADPTSLDPPHVQESEGYRVAVMIFDGLVDYDPKTLEVKAELAESWEVSDDATVWTFKIKKGIKFHNGQEVKAEDFKKCWERACAKDTASEVAYILAPIKGYDEMQEGKAKELSGVKVVDDYTLEVTLKYPFGEFLQTLGHPVAAVYPVEIAEKAVKEKEVWETTIVGTGPFKFISWKHKQEVVLERNPDYWGKAPYLDKIQFRVFADENTAFLEYKAGKLHDAMIPAGQYKTTKADPKLGPQVTVGPELALYYYGFNVEKGIFAKDKNLRLAVIYATNKQAIIDTVMEGLPTPATGIVPKGIPGYKSEQVEWTYNIDKAKDFWAKSTKPSEIALTYNTSPAHQKIAEAAQAGYKEAGINVKLVNIEWGTYLDRLSKGEYSFYRLGWIADYPSMDNFLYPLFHSSEKGNNNFCFYENKEVDKLLEDARKETDADKRHELYAEAEKKILDDAPLVPIYFYSFARTVQPEVKDYNWNAMGLVNFDEIWLSTEK